MKYTRYFENEVLRKRPELRLEWVEEAVLHPDKKRGPRRWKNSLLEVDW
ncbi:hypothetical protein LEP1GSC070_2458 [Leptospira santarosai str. AIM]|nr:hypothetical protein LEP1GSC070_2458 [Leptospira santarosai str. AIM]